MSEELLEELEEILTEDYGVTFQLQDLADFATKLTTYFGLLVRVNQRNYEKSISSFRLGSAKN